MAQNRGDWVAHSFLSSSSICCHMRLCGGGGGAVGGDIFPRGHHHRPHHNCPKECDSGDTLGRVPGAALLTTRRLQSMKPRSRTPTQPSSFTVQVPPRLSQLWPGQ